MRSFSIPYSDRWVEAGGLTHDDLARGYLSVSPTRIVGLRRPWRGCGSGARAPTFSIPYSDRWVEARDLGLGPAGADRAFSIPYSDRWVEALADGRYVRPPQNPFQYPLLGSLG